MTEEYVIIKAKTTEEAAKITTDLLFLSCKIKYQQIKGEHYLNIVYIENKKQIREILKNVEYKKVH